MAQIGQTVDFLVLVVGWPMLSARQDTTVVAVAARGAFHCKSHVEWLGGVEERFIRRCRKQRLEKRPLTSSPAIEQG